MQNSDHWKKLTRRLVFTAICLACLAPAVADANLKTEQLEQKIADLALLYQQLEDRSQQAAAIRSALAAQRKTLETEIYFLMKSEKIDSYEQADKNLRIHYNVELLGSILAYSTVLEEKIKEYEIGRDKLAYLQKLAQDDIKMIAALDNLKIDALMTQISLVINRYLPDAHVIQLDPDAIAPVKPRTVWQQVVAKAE